MFVKAVVFYRDDGLQEMRADLVLGQGNAPLPLIRDQCCQGQAFTIFDPR